MPSDRAFWSSCRNDFSLALSLSTAAVILLTGVLGMFRLHEEKAPASGEFCSINHCLASRDGRCLLVSYWRASRGRQSISRGLATLNLMKPCEGFEMIPSAAQPYGLAQLEGKHCYVADAGGRLALRRIGPDQQASSGGIVLPEGCPAELASSANGQTVVTCVSGKLQVRDIQKNAVRWLRERDVECFVLHERSGLFASVNGEIVQLSLETGAVLRSLARSVHGIRRLAIDPSGDCIAWLDWAGGVELRRLSDGKPLWRQETHGAQMLPATHRPMRYAPLLAFSTDGRQLVTAAEEGEWVLAIWHASTGNRLKTLRGHDQVINGAVFLPDGALASWSADGTLRLWNVRRGTLRRIVSVKDVSRSAEQHLRGAT